MAIVIAGRIRIKAEAREEATSRGAEMAAASREEAGCGNYRFGFDFEDPLYVLIQEEWESEDALNAHLATLHFQAFTAYILGVVDGPADLIRHEVTASRPLFG